MSIAGFHFQLQAGRLSVTNLCGDSTDVGSPTAQVVPLKGFDPNLSPLLLAVMIDAGMTTTEGPAASEQDRVPRPSTCER